MPTKKVGIMMDTWRRVFNRTRMISVLSELYSSWRRWLLNKAKNVNTEYKLSLHAVFQFLTFTEYTLNCYSDLWIKIIEWEFFLMLVLLSYRPSLLHSSL